MERGHHTEGHWAERGRAPAAAIPDGLRGPGLPGNVTNTFLSLLNEFKSGFSLKAPGVFTNITYFQAF